MVLTGGFLLCFSYRPKKFHYIFVSLTAFQELIDRPFTTFKIRPMKDLDFKSLLDQQYQFPCAYTFKFVVAATKKRDVEGLMKAEILRERPSRSGRYVGLTFTQTVQSSDEVIATYHKVSALEGVIPL